MQAGGDGDDLHGGFNPPVPATFTLAPAGLEDTDGLGIGLVPMSPQMEPPPGQSHQPPFFEVPSFERAAEPAMDASAGFMVHGGDGGNPMLDGLSSSHSASTVLEHGASYETAPPPAHHAAPLVNPPPAPPVLPPSISSSVSGGSVSSAGSAQPPPSAPPPGAKEERPEKPSKRTKRQR
jgi:hypothetical protein